MFDDLLQGNARYAADFDLGDLPRSPKRQLIIVTCMDARISVLAALGLELGDAHILRNAGGRVSDDVIRSLVVSTRVLGVDHVVVMHHTGCGMASISRRDVLQMLSDIDAEHLESFDIMAIEDQQLALREDVEAVRTSPLLPPVEVAGMIYDVATGLVSRVA